MTTPGDPSLDYSESSSGSGSEDSDFDISTGDSPLTQAVAGQQPMLSVSPTNGSAIAREPPQSDVPPVNALAIAGELPQSETLPVNALAIAGELPQSETPPVSASTISREPQQSERLPIAAPAIAGELPQGERMCRFMHIPPLPEMPSLFHLEDDNDVIVVEKPEPRDPVKDDPAPLQTALSTNPTAMEIDGKENKEEENTKPPEPSPVGEPMKKKQKKSHRSLELLKQLELAQKQLAELQEEKRVLQQNKLQETPDDGILRTLSEDKLKDVAEANRLTLLKTEQELRKRKANNLHLQSGNLFRSAEETIRSLNEVQNRIREDNKILMELLSERGRITEETSEMRHQAIMLLSELKEEVEKESATILREVNKSTMDIDILFTSFTPDKQNQRVVSPDIGPTSPMYSPVRPDEDPPTGVAPDLPPLERMESNEEKFEKVDTSRADNDIRFTHLATYRYIPKDKINDYRYHKHTGSSQSVQFQVITKYVEPTLDHPQPAYRRPGFKFVCPKGYFCHDNHLGICRQYHTLRQHCVATAPEYKTFLENELKEPTQEIMDKMRKLALQAAVWYPTEVDHHGPQGQRLRENGSVDKRAPSNFVSSSSSVPWSSIVGTSMPSTSRERGHRDSRENEIALRANALRSNGSRENEATLRANALRTSRERDNRDYRDSDRDNRDYRESDRDPQYQRGFRSSRGRSRD